MIHTENRAEFLQAYLLEHIPITQALAIKVNYCSGQRVSLSAPLLANINHKKTVFGGSLHAVATLACWGLVFINLLNRQYPAEIVIAESQIDYLLPVENDFTAESVWTDPQNWEKFYRLLMKKKRGRIEVNAKIYQNEQLAVNYRGTFVALMS